MSQAAMAHKTGNGLLAPALLLTALLGLVAFQLDVVRFPAATDTGLAPQTVTITSRNYAYRASGDFLRGGVAVDGPLVVVDAPPVLDIMTYQVSAADYGRCVAEGACDKAEPRRRGSGNVPVTGVSFDDATSYSDWLSARTGETWRLPTVAEWQFAAGSKAGDEGLGFDTDSGNPAERWLAFYEKQAALGAGALATPEPLGSGGFNEFGVADLSGAVWEWTTTCGGRTSLGADGAPLSQLQSCGVRYLEGRHRTPMSAFIRDAQSGGCSTGTPPDNLGFRLVRERGWLAWLLGSGT